MPEQQHKHCACFNPKPEDKFQTELQALLNKYSKEDDSNTADFILADYLNKCLDNFNYFVRYREQVNCMPPLAAVPDPEKDDREYN
jgi:hypothetical protein